jgi:hypothetical protein
MMNNEDAFGISPASSMLKLMPSPVDRFARHDFRAQDAPFFVPPVQSPPAFQQGRIVDLQNGR